MTVTLQWLGQSSFLLSAPGCRVGLDLYLSDHLATKYRGTDKPHDRLHGCPVTPADLGDLDWIFASHKHSDHLDPGSIAAVMAAAPAVLLVLPAPLLDYAVSELHLPLDRLRPVVPGDVVGPFRLLPAKHPEVSPSLLSTIVDVGGLSIFHSGDTLCADELHAALCRIHPDVVLLPANGRIAEHLGTPPNMSLEEGVELARDCGARLLIPHHYDLFAFNSRPLDDVRRVLEASGVPYLVPAVGEIVDLSAALEAAAIPGERARSR